MPAPARATSSASFRNKGIDLAGAIVLSDNLRSFVAYPEVEAAGAIGFRVHDELA